MNDASAPGPDGFGPNFYRAAWPTVKDRVMGFLHAFHQGTADLERANCSYMVLFPKKPDMSTVDAYRPICLRNCSIKIAAKILTSRLQQDITETVDLDQIGFLHGRSITENFVYAMELVQVCHKHRAPAIVLKLDFAKAFDTVNWDGLMEIMSARGFSEQWNNWVKQLLHTSRSRGVGQWMPGTLDYLSPGPPARGSNVSMPMCCKP
ncbi:unnamed protein product [Urochloa humidicola]